MSRNARFIAALALIVVATFPYDFMTHAHWRRVSWVPFTTGIVRPRDMLLNLLLYAPFGACFPGTRTRRVVAFCLLSAFVLSCLLELTQVWSHVRFPSATDVAMNVIGAAAGVCLGWARAHRRQSPGGNASVAELSSR